jgi:hypothetical protein
MTMTKPKPGDKYRLATEEPLGIDFPIMPGTIVTVREIVKADDPGAHDNTEDAVVVEGEPFAIVVTDEDGTPQIGYTARAWSVGLDEFARDYTKEV